MRNTILLVLISCLASACGSSPAEKQMEAQAIQIKEEAKFTAEKTETLKEYKKCVKKSDGDPDNLRVCEALLKVWTNNLLWQIKKKAPIVIGAFNALLSRSCL